MASKSRSLDSSLTITLRVWRALILRESESRLFASRVSWLWVFLEPVFHVGYLMFLFTSIEVKKVGQLDTAIWLMVGLQGYFIFRKTGDGVAGAPSSNRGLFAYRQVKTADTLIARALLEGFMWAVSTLCMIVVVNVWGHPFVPDDPLALIGAYFGLWLNGIGFGMIVSTITALVKEGKLLLKVVMRPMYMISGVIFPLSTLPVEWREVLMWNPVANAIETARHALSRHYYPVPETDSTYVFTSALVLLAFGLALQARFEDRVAEQ